MTVGLVDGCYVVLLPILTTSLVGLENSVLAWGFLIGTSSITFTLGPPVAGKQIMFWLGRIVIHEFESLCHSLDPTRATDFLFSANSIIE